MKKLHYVLLIFISNFIYSQNNFEINLTSDSYINDSLILGAPMTRKGFGDLYTFNLQPNKNISKFGSDHSLYFIKVQKENLINGFIEYPQPVAFVYLDKKNKSASGTKIFFLEKGKYKIDLPQNINFLDFNIDTPTNREYKILQKALEKFYVKSNNPYQQDSLVSLDKKEEFLTQYIKQNPNSYVALWEIVSDYTMYNYHPGYLKNLNLFSAKFKQN